MRAIAVSVWIFINLVFIGMCGYIYLLWSQYWQYVERQHNQLAGIINNNHNIYSSNGQIYFYYHGSSETISMGVSSNRENQTVKNYVTNKSSPRHHLRSRSNKTSTTVIKKYSQPRFPKLRGMDTDVESQGPRCSGDSSECLASPDLPLVNDKLSARVATYKSQLVVQLRRVLLEESSVFKARGDGNNPYNVQYAGPRGSYQGKSVHELVCELQNKVKIRTLSENDEPFSTLGLSKQFPDEPLLGKPGKHFNTCAIVTNAGSLDGSGLGNFIDTHDVVLRFNHAPTEGYESDVGSKTTLRILNSQVVSKPEFNFLTSALYQGISLLAWDPSNYSSSLEEWYENPDFDVFTPYFKHREKFPDAVFHLLDPRSQWLLWEYIQSHIPVRIRKNPPSSGFLGLALLLPHCAYVDLFEYVPSVRLTKRCHYWDVAEDLSCTFGVWHPLAAEKLLALALNTANDVAVFYDGYVRVPGYKTLGC
ncbi:beta-galactoside alpha-2,6-sialyltransferase 2 [Schistocerca serialis cubense]|uniref:beta-galactoside alpha-2,6-sialyltransferase 2 n=1 Tax=Schistocerca serialis cubense TaxID=2023355 RepID=UPI00214E5FAF|nr:beta-galactoside alpha-2,6-sialyltransferase 2 [Schistocerca serialis cubense]